MGLAARLVCKGDIEAIVQKRIGIGLFARLGAIERQCDFVPLFEFAADFFGRNGLGPAHCRQCHTDRTKPDF